MRFDDPQRRLNALREYLQAFIMRSLHESEAGRAVAFVGGTALRFLEDLPRFSEDLDFSRVSDDGYEPVRWFEKLKRDLHFAGFDSTIRWIEREPVQVAWVRTAHLLAEAGLSGHARQNLSVKVEIDIRPPAGAAVQRTLVTRQFTFVISHYDLEIPEYWIVDPRTAEVTVLTYRNGSYIEHGTFAREAPADSPLLPGLAIDIRALFDAGRA